MVNIGANRHRLRRKTLQAKFKEDGRKGVTVFELADIMPVQQAPLSCERCGHHAFHAEYSMDGNLILACDKCHYESLIKGIIFSESRISQEIIDPQGMMPGHVRCKRCNCKRWVLYRLAEDELKMGCNGRGDGDGCCVFEWVCDLRVMGARLRDEFKYAGKIII